MNDLYHSLLISKQRCSSNIYEIFDIISNNFSTYYLVSPYAAFRIIRKQDFWFCIHNDKKKIIAECSVNRVGKRRYMITNLNVHCEYSQQDYINLLIMNVLLFFEQNFNRGVFIYIECKVDNYIVWKIFEVIFGTPHFTDDKYLFYRFCIPKQSLNRQ